MNQLVDEILKMWPDCKLVHGKPRHSQSQGSVERANLDTENLLVCWMQENSTTSWSRGLPQVQFQKNTRFHSGIGRTPYEALFGTKPKCGIKSTNLPQEVLDLIVTEEDLQQALQGGDKTPEVVVFSEQNRSEAVTAQDDNFNSNNTTEFLPTNQQVTIRVPQASHSSLQGSVLCARPADVATSNQTVTFPVTSNLVISLY